MCASLYIWREPIYPIVTLSSLQFSIEIDYGCLVPIATPFNIQITLPFLEKTLYPMQPNLPISYQHCFLIRNTCISNPLSSNTLGKDENCSPKVMN